MMNTPVDGDVVLEQDVTVERNADTATAQLKADGLGTSPLQRSESGSPELVAASTTDGMTSSFVSSAQASSARATPLPTSLDRPHSAESSHPHHSHYQGLPPKKKITSSQSMPALAVTGGHKRTDSQHSHNPLNRLLQEPPNSPKIVGGDMYSFGNGYVTDEDEDDDANTALPNEEANLNFRGDVAAPAPLPATVADKLNEIHDRFGETFGLVSQDINLEKILQSVQVHIWIDAGFGLSSDRKINPTTEDAKFYNADTIETDKLCVMYHALEILAALDPKIWEQENLTKLVGDYFKIALIMAIKSRFGFDSAGSMRTKSLLELMGIKKPTLASCHNITSRHDAEVIKWKIYIHHLVKLEQEFIRTLGPNIPTYPSPTLQQLFINDKKVPQPRKEDEAAQQSALELEQRDGEFEAKNLAAEDASDAMRNVSEWPCVIEFWGKLTEEQSSSLRYLIAKLQIIAPDITGLALANADKAVISYVDTLWTLVQLTAEERQDLIAKGEAFNQSLTGKSEASLSKLNKRLMSIMIAGDVEAPDEVPYQQFSNLVHYKEQLAEILKKFPVIDSDEHIAHLADFIAESIKQAEALLPKATKDVADFDDDLKSAQNQKIVYLQKYDIGSLYSQKDLMNQERPGTYVYYENLISAEKATKQKLFAEMMQAQRRGEDTAAMVAGIRQADETITNYAIMMDAVGQKINEKASQQSKALKENVYIVAMDDLDEVNFHITVNEHGEGVKLAKSALLALNQKLLVLKELRALNTPQEFNALKRKVQLTDVLAESALVSLDKQMRPAEDVKDIAAPNKEDDASEAEAEAKQDSAADTQVALQQQQQFILKLLNKAHLAHLKLDFTKDAVHELLQDDSNANQAFLIAYREILTASSHDANERAQQKQALLDFENKNQQEIKQQVEPALLKQLTPFAANRVTRLHQDYTKRALRPLLHDDILNEVYKLLQNEIPANRLLLTEYWGKLTARSDNAAESAQYKQALLDFENASLPAIKQQVKPEVLEQLAALAEQQVARLHLDSTRQELPPIAHNSSLDDYAFFFAYWEKLTAMGIDNNEQVANKKALREFEQENQPRIEQLIAPLIHQLWEQDQQTKDLIQNTDPAIYTDEAQSGQQWEAFQARLKGKWGKLQSFFPSLIEEFCIDEDAFYKAREEYRNAFQLKLEADNGVDILEQTRAQRRMDITEDNYYVTCKAMRSWGIKSNSKEFDTRVCRRQLWDNWLELRGVTESNDVDTVRKDADVFFDEKIPRWEQQLFAQAKNWTEHPEILRTKLLKFRLDKNELIKAPQKPKTEAEIAAEIDKQIQGFSLDYQECEQKREAVKVEKEAIIADIKHDIQDKLPTLSQKIRNEETPKQDRLLDAMEAQLDQITLNMLQGQSQMFLNDISNFKEKGHKRHLTDAEKELQDAATKLQAERTLQVTPDVLGPKKGTASVHDVVKSAKELVASAVTSTRTIERMLDYEHHLENRESRAAPRTRQLDDIEAKKRPFLEVLDTLRVDRNNPLTAKERLAAVRAKFKDEDFVKSMTHHRDSIGMLCIKGFCYLLATLTVIGLIALVVRSNRSSKKSANFIKSHGAVILDDVTKSIDTNPKTASNMLTHVEATHRYTSPLLRGG